MNQHGVIYCWCQVCTTVTTSIGASQLANTMVATSITINVATSTINVCQHADDKLLISQQWCGLEDASCICSCQLCIYSEVCCGTVGRCGDGWKLRRITGEARNMMENALSILIVIFSVQLQQTEISEKTVYFPPWGYSNCWRLRRLLEATAGCRRCPQYDGNAFSILIVIFPHNSNKPRPQTESCIFSDLALNCKSAVYLIYLL